MNIKKLVAAGVAAVCMVSMAACGGSSSSSGDKKTDLTYDQITLGKTGKDITTTIKFYNGRTDMSLDSYPGKNWNAYIEDFNKLYPNIKVESQADSNYADNALTRLQGGDWGDIMMIPAVDKSEMSNYFISYGDTDTMSKQVKLASEKAYDGQTYGVATDGQTSGVIYNKKVFKEAGITELPKTPEEFINALKAIKDKTDAIPLYTNYAAGFTMGAWDAYIGTTATGDNTYMNQKLVHTKAPFADPGDGTHAYNVYKVLYDAVNQSLTEEDYSTTDWESSKSMINNGQIGTMVLGAWAVTQMQQAGDNADDIGYMPFPISVNGKQYAAMGGNYSMGINVKSSKDNQEAAMIFVKWLTEKSGYAMNEGGIPIKYGEEDLPSIYEDFKEVKMEVDADSLEGEEDLFTEVNSDSELGINSNGNKRVQAIVEHAANKDKSYDDMANEWNEAWYKAMQNDNAEAKY